MSYADLICSQNGQYINGTFDQFYNATITYDKLVDAYINNNCLSNSAAPFNIQLSATDSISGSASTITGTNCQTLGNNLVTYGNLINNKSVNWMDDIRTKGDSYKINAIAVGDTYNNVLSKRKELDENVQKIIGQEGTPIYEKQAILDSAVYTTLLWTVLATSVLFYAFTKL